MVVLSLLITFMVVRLQKKEEMKNCTGKGFMKQNAFSMHLRTKLSFGIQ